jgi:outer membrane lipoprotein-sorting protein
MRYDAFMHARALIAILTLSTLSTVTATAQTVDEIVAKNLQAKGGVQQLKAVQAMRVTAHVSPEPGTDIQMTITTERPNKLRQDTSLKGQQMVMAFDGETAWTINPMMGSTGPQKIEGPEFDRLKTQADMDGPLVDYKSKGTTVELIGQETVEGVKTHKLKVTRKDGQSQELFVDVNTGLEVKAVNEVEQAGQKATIESYFSNYRTVGGLTVAHTIVQKIMGRDVTVTVDKVEILPDVDDSVFKMPAK